MFGYSSWKIRISLSPIYIYTNLHLPVKIYAREKGNTSIQINSLREILQKRPFRNLKSFARDFEIEFDNKTKKLKNFKLFVVMDTDDCTEEMKNDYISGKLFAGLLLEPYIVPIYNDKNLEDVLGKTELMPKKIKEKDKEKYYSKIFPVYRGSVTNKSIDQVNCLLKCLQDVKGTNLPEMINHFLSLVDKK